MIRKAEMGDRDSITLMAESFAKAANMPFEFSPNYFSMTLSMRIVSKNSLCLVLDLEGKPSGFLLASVVKSALFPVTAVQEEVFWIEPQSRGRWLRPFLANYEEWIREKGVPVAALCTLNDERTGRVFRRLGWTPTETQFLKEF